jgi:hypothetical protein
MAESYGMIETGEGSKDMPTMNTGKDRSQKKQRDCHDPDMAIKGSRGSHTWRTDNQQTGAAVIQKKEKNKNEQWRNILGRETGFSRHPKGGYQFNQSFSNA